ncbi:MFS transporter [Streptomyces caniferus]|uniref:MFS transporter n=1 Tax=Streptomyces caniferus TaxID=285557 RepID=A0A640S6V9_9ACTN|nr:MFS transporter [Streptomyces caniferus]GFE06920.1 MFS transporter [Streptomyces caniferus]
MTQTAQPRGETAAAPTSLWRNRNFMLLWFGQGAGTLGPRTALIVLPVLALDTLHAGTFQVSLLTSLGWLPYLLFSLPAGVLADRLDQRKIMIFCDVARLLLILSVPLIALAGRLTLWYLYAVVGVSGVLTVLFTVAYRSQLPKLVSASQLVDGNGKLGMCESLAEVAGPGLGGALVGLVGATRTLYANVLTYALSALTLGLIRVPKSEQGPPAGARPVPFRAAMGEGLTFVRKQVILRRLLLCTSVCNFFVTAASSIAVTFLLRDLHASATTVGLVFTLGSVGGLVTGAFARRISARIGSARVIWVSMLLPGPLYFLMPLSQPGWGVFLYAVGLAALSANSTLFNTAALSYRQLVCPRGLLSRVSAVYLWISYGVVPLGSLFGGALATGAGLRPALWVCVLGMWSASLFVVFSPLRRMREVQLPEAAAA